MTKNATAPLSISRLETGFAWCTRDMQNEQALDLQFQDGNIRCKLRLQKLPTTPKPQDIGLVFNMFGKNAEGIPCIKKAKRFALDTGESVHIIFDDSASYLLTPDPQSVEAVAKRKARVERLAAAYPIDDRSKAPSNPAPLAA